MTAAISSGCSFGQAMADQTPKYDSAVRKRRFSSNQKMGKSGIIRRDKRKKVKYL